MNITLPIDAVLAITYKCNSRCVMCDIWKIREHNDVKPEVYAKLPRTLRTINISGGEPFLNPDIVEIIKNVKKTCTYSKLIISSNGFLPVFIANKMREILKIDPKIGVAISIDGLSEMQFKIRGIVQGFEKNMRTLELLRELGMTNLRIAFTVTPENVSHLSKVYDLSRELGVQFTCAVAQSSDFYFGGKHNDPILGSDELEREFNYVIARELRQFSPKRWARAYFAYGLKNFALHGDPILPAESAYLHFFMDPRGDVYPSVVHNRIMGNLREQSFGELWHGQKADEAREYVRSNKSKVWMICTARSSIRKHPLKAGVWFVKNRLFANM